MKKNIKIRILIRNTWSSLSETMPQHVRSWHMKQYSYFQKYWKIPPKIIFLTHSQYAFPILKNPYFHYILHVSIFSFTIFIPLYFYTQYIDMIPHMHSTINLASFDVYCGCTLLHPQRSHSFPKLTLVCHFLAGAYTRSKLKEKTYNVKNFKSKFQLWIMSG